MGLTKLPQHTESIRTQNPRALIGNPETWGLRAVGTRRSFARKQSQVKSRHILKTRVIQEPACQRILDISWKW